MFESLLVYLMYLIRCASWEIWLNVEPQILKYCQKRWRENCDDILSQTKIIFIEKAVGGKFIFRSLEESEKYGICIARRVARDVIGFNNIRRETGYANDIAASPNETNERLQTIIENGSPHVKSVIAHVLAGENITISCMRAGTKYKEFRREAKKTYELYHVR